MQGLKDYKAIAEIIKKHYDILSDAEGFDGIQTQQIKEQIKAQAKDLADYFEKDIFETTKDKRMASYIRKQFLKDCGVEE